MMQCVNLICDCSSLEAVYETIIYIRCQLQSDSLLLQTISSMLVIHLELLTSTSELLVRKDIIGNETRLHVIGKLRCDARLRYFYTGPQKARGRKRTYSEAVDLTAIETPPEHADGFEWVTTAEENIEVYRAWVYAPAFKRPIQVVYLVKIAPTQFAEALLFCTDKSLSALDVYRYYRARFQIEFIFRDAKQFLGLTHCQARDSQKLDFHVNSVLMTLNVLKVHWASNQASVSIKRPFSVANYKRRASNEYLLQSFIERSGLELTCENLKSQYLQCLDIGLITA